MMKLMTPQTAVGFAAVALLAFAAHASYAQTPTEQAELDADAAGLPGPTPAVTGTGISCPAGTVPTTFYFNDFETDAGGWTGGGMAPWEWGPVVTGVFENCDTVPEDEPAGASSGVNAWATNLNGCYTNSGSESLLSQTFDFSGLSAPIQLSWFNWYEVFLTFDMAQLRVNGSTLFEVPNATPTGVYVEQSVDLSAFAGNPSVTIDYRLFATTVVNRAGWYVDDVLIETCSAAEADLALTKVADSGEAGPGDTVLYTLTVANNGPGDASNVVVSDTLPAGLAYVADDCGGNFVDPTFTWNVGALADGANAICNVSVSVDADAAGTLVNAATATADNSDPNTANNDDDAAIVIGGVSAVEIPTVGSIGMLALLALLATTATLLLRRRQRAG